MADFLLKSMGDKRKINDIFKYYGVGIQKSVNLEFHIHKNIHRQINANQNIFRFVKIRKFFSKRLEL